MESESESESEREREREREREKERERETHTRIPGSSLLHLALDLLNNPDLLLPRLGPLRYSTQQRTALLAHPHALRLGVGIKHSCTEKGRERERERERERHTHT